MASTSDLRTGLVIMFNGELCTVLEHTHRTPGKGAAFYQVKLRKIRDGRLLENRFRSGESIEVIRVDRKEMQYLYKDGENMVFMDAETYEQIPVHLDLLGDKAGFLKESGEATISFVDTDIVDIDIPVHVTLEITETEPGVKGDTASSATKPATVESGATINVPLFINEGDQVRVDTRTGEYMDRVKV